MDSCPAPRSPTSSFAKVTRSRTLTPSDVVQLDGLSVTSRSRTVVDLAALVPGHELERIVESALRGPDHRRPDQWRTEVLDELRQRVAGTHHQPGLSQLAACLRLRPEGCRPTGSIAETAMVQLFRASGVGNVIRQPKIVVLQADGERLSFFPDLLLPERRLVIEIDGGDHLDRARHRADLARQNELLAGFRVLRFTAVDALAGDQRLVAKVLKVKAVDAATSFDRLVTGGGLLWTIH